MTRSESRHIPALDGIRGLAILMVMVFHFASWAEESVHAPALFALTGLGRGGVDLFFVLSGFLITGILLETKDAPGYFRNFFVRRALRIFPLYYLTVAMMVVAARFSPGNEKLQVVAHNQAWLWTYSSNLIMSWRNSWCFFGLNHFWSLSIEEQFYFVWPFIVWWLDRRRLMQVCFAASVLALGLRAILCYRFNLWQAAYVLPFCRMDALLLGAALAVSTRETSGAMSRWRAYAQVLAVAGLAGLGVVLLLQLAGDHVFGGAADRVFGPTVWAIVFSGLIAAHATAGRGPLRSIYEGRLRFFGKYSYGLYVFHHPLRQVWQKLAPPARLAAVTHSPGLGVVLFTTVGIAGSTVLAWLSYRFVESRFLALKDRLGTSAASSTAVALEAEPSA